MLDVHNLTGRAVARDGEEEHRASTPLELFFDLTFVVAVGRVAGTLHEELVAGRIREGLIGFGAMLFAVVLAWMEFTWFATAHDSDDVPFRLLTFVQITGALVFATGVTRAMTERDFTVCVVGYVIMRAGLVTAWLRVARDVPQSRTRALRYAALLVGIQVLWVAWLWIPEDLRYPAFVVLAVLELVLPAVADRDPLFHPEHIEERYGLFTLIVLGESVLSAAVGFQAAFDEGGLNAQLLTIGLSSLLGSFAAWWLYFDHPGHLTPTRENAFRWGYGHIFLFASLAAMGAGAHVAAEAATGHASERTAALAVAIPGAGFLLSLVLLMIVNHARLDDVHVWPKVAGAAIVVIGGLTLPFAVAVATSAGVIALLALWMVLAGEGISQRERARGIT